MLKDVLLMFLWTLVGAVILDIVLMAATGSETVALSACFIWGAFRGWQWGKAHPLNQE